MTVEPVAGSRGMKRTVGCALLLCLLGPWAAAAEGPRPVPRPPHGAVVEPVPRPVPRPAPAVAPATGRLPGDGPQPEEAGAAGRRPAGPGAVCGSSAILGERLPAIDGAGACGIRRPVSLTSVAGVALEPNPTLGCPAARALLAWLEDAAKPAFAAEGPRLVGLDIAAAYVCRNVNYAEDGEMSEHARGRAVDISGFSLADGSRVGVRDGWEADEHGELLRQVHEGACGIFRTAIGPDSDAYHEDHFHYDVAERNRPYCP